MYDSCYILMYTTDTEFDRILFDCCVWIAFYRFFLATQHFGFNKFFMNFVTLPKNAIAIHYRVHYN